jgi:DNA mismatch endonuclease (patch repair protein)
MDTLTSAQRSERMSRVRHKDTTPEMVVRRLVHGLGYRYRLHRRDLPGQPDLVFPGRRKVILVHGCFWHQHGCPIYRYPKSRLDFWGPKRARNVQRDQQNQARLHHLGWDVLVVWECQAKRADTADLAVRLRDFLEATSRHDRSPAPSS